jgi:hypothetical protein
MKEHLAPNFVDTTRLTRAEPRRSRARSRRRRLLHCLFDRLQSPSCLLRAVLVDGFRLYPAWAASLHPPSLSGMGSVAASAGLLPQAPTCPAAYRQRNPRATALYQLLDKHYETVKGLWEERFERRYGFWRGYWDNAVASYLDCGDFESG